MALTLAPAEQAPRLSVLGVSGSLRQASYNRALLHAARELAPAGMEIRIFSLAGLPLYDGDVEAAGDPEPVVAWKEAIRSADGLLIATPEYNHGTSGVLKNAIDWASRPARQSVLDAKPVALMGASAGLGGTAQAQADVRNALAFPGAQAMAGPALHVSRVRAKFDEHLRLTDEVTREGLRELLKALVDWTGRLRVLTAAA